LIVEITANCIMRNIKLLGLEIINLKKLADINRISWEIGKSIKCLKILRSLKVRLWKLWDVQEALSDSFGWRIGKWLKRE